jgi:hypothetical protein
VADAEGGGLHLHEIVERVDVIGHVHQPHVVEQCDAEKEKHEVAHVRHQRHAFLQVINQHLFACHVTRKAFFHVSPGAVTRPVLPRARDDLAAVGRHRGDWDGALLEGALPPSLARAVIAACAAARARTRGRVMAGGRRHIDAGRRGARALGELAFAGHHARRLSGVEPTCVARRSVIGANAHGAVRCQDTVATLDLAVRVGGIHGTRCALGAVVCARALGKRLLATRGCVATSSRRDGIRELAVATLDLTAHAVGLERAGYT